jgi:glycosyltransferase involved in cell wall biosynthesis
MNYIERHIEARTLHNANVITSVSNKVAKELQKYYRVDGDSVTIIGNGVDTRFYIPRKNKNGDRVYVLYSGRLGHRKGLFDLVKSATYICHEHPEVSFVVTGRGPLEGNLKKLVKKMKLSNRFSFVGFVDRKVLLNYYQNATVYVLPSHYEGFPTVILEAMACGIPVVTTSVGGIAETVVNGKNGFIVPMKNPKAIASAVLKLLENENLRIGMGKIARQTVEKFYSWDKIACKVLECYESAIARA